MNPSEHALEEEEVPGIDLREYLTLILKHRWIVLAGMLLGVGLALFYMRSRPVSYRASASVLVNTEAPRVLGHEVEGAVEYGTSTWSASRSSFYNSQLTIMRSQAVAELSVKEAKLFDVPEVAGRGSSNERYRNAMAAVRSSISVSLGDNQRVVWVTATHRNPVAAAAIANALVAGYEAFNRRDYRSGNADATEWLSGELDVAEKELAKAEADIVAFKKENNLLSFNLENQRSLLGKRIEHYADAASRARTERIEREMAFKKISEASKSDIGSSPIFDIADSDSGRLLRQKLVAATIELESLSASLGPRHPTRLEQVERIKKLEAAMRDEATLVTNAAHDEFKKAASVEARMNDELERLKEEALALGPKEIAHGELLRKRAEAEQRARHLRERFNDNSMAGRLDTTNIRPLDKALVPGRPAARPMYQYAGAGALVGMLMAIGLIILIHQLDSRVHRVAQIEEIGGTGFLGALPVFDEKKGNQAQVLSRFQEALRIVRTNLSFLAPDVEQKTIMVTSPQPQDGKSTTAYWLAVSLSQMGKKVLLVDADMRSPSLHGIVGIHRTDGLSDLIVGNIELDEAIRQTEHERVALIPAGQAIRDPAESLASKRFKALLDKLHERYDVIVLDTPPVLPVADASLLCRLADVALVIGRCGSTEKSALRVALSQLHRSKPASLGVIANAADVRAERYYYRGYEGYGYGQLADIDLEHAAKEASNS